MWFEEAKPVLKLLFSCQYLSIAVHRIGHGKFLSRCSLGDCPCSVVGILGLPKQFRRVYSFFQNNCQDYELKCLRRRPILMYCHSKFDLCR